MENRYLASFNKLLLTTKHFLRRNSIKWERSCSRFPAHFITPCKRLYVKVIKKNVIQSQKASQVKILSMKMQQYIIVFTSFVSIKRVFACASSRKYLRVSRNSIITFRTRRNLPNLCATEWCCSKMHIQKS